MKSIWDKVVLATNNSLIAKKRFLSRSGRYSGLQNVLTFADLETGKLEQLGTVLAGATAWLAFNVSRENILPYSTAALDAGLKRVLFSLEIPSIECPEVVNIPEFDEAINAFKERNASFTGIRHSTVIDGDENNPYCIVNSTSPTLYLPVNRGVVA